MIVLHVAVAAQHLDRLGGDLHGHVGAGHLGHGGGGGVGLALLLVDGGPVEQQLSGVDLGLELGHLEGQVLLLAQGLAELLALHDVLPGDLKGALGNAQALGSHADAAAVQSLHGQLEALAGLGDHVLGGNPDVLQDHVRDLGAADAHLVLQLTHGEAGGALLHHEGGHALGAQSGIGEAVDHGVVGQRSVGVEALGAVDDVAVAVLGGHGLLAGSVGTGGVLGQAEGADLLTVGNGGQELLLDLGGGGGVHDAAAVQRGVHGEGDAEGGIHLGDLLHGQDVAQIAAAQAAHFGTVRQAVDAGLAQLAEGFQGELGGLVPLDHAGKQFVLCKFTGNLLNLLLVLSQFKGHDASSFL